MKTDISSRDEHHYTYVAWDGWTVTDRAMGTRVHQYGGTMLSSRKKIGPEMRVIPRFVYNPEKAERALEAMADILADALDRPRVGAHKAESGARPT